MAAILVGLFVLAIVAVPLALSVRSDRRRERADVVAAAVRSAVRQRLGGDSFVTVEVQAPSFARRGRVMLAAPTGYGWMLERVWTAAAPRVPVGYDLVVSRPDAGVAPKAPAVAPSLRRAA
jgi:hypothetical protein